MSDDETQVSPSTVGELMAVLQHADLPNDADVVIAPGPALIDVDPSEYPEHLKVVDITAVRGFGEPSRLTIHME